MFKFLSESMDKNINVLMPHCIVRGFAFSKNIEYLRVFTDREIKSQLKKNQEYTPHTPRPRPD